jgi:hypothetical protein
MIRETINRKSSPAVTSDQWHVLHARWSGDLEGEPRFLRSIVSEHADSAAAANAARKIVSLFTKEMVARPRETRDQILVRRPGYKSLKTAKRVEKRHK